ncbi:hypothetical protein FUT69_09115 [Xylella taiwanensis]|uniref:Uncharacterized protein n=1 Tax=Xylella taiwanensis TaxID=1444770 RepID=Z9JN87_9GAMM|nr:hypothetical protein [Xylella taiwanensis]EWS79266.1 hypothetical protein AF72_01815 [Xylella taiwanensis]MCD8456337.1 hypothetical protein [Xylella taiwanensis]MCD8458745.1 hypothetical protein [Xylella taiwanensis]MCD8460881.1 hypothetical protein [Xylella taiwanensis]MCD8463060.1 hypothetical protein [Xylella taiwanensis]
MSSKFHTWIAQRAVQSGDPHHRNRATHKELKSQAIQQYLRKINMFRLHAFSPNLSSVLMLAVLFYIAPEAKRCASMLALSMLVCILVIVKIQWNDTGLSKRCNTGVGA